LSGKDGKVDEFEINPEVQTMAHRALVIDLGLCIARQVPNKELDEYPLMRIVPKLEDEELEIFDDFESIVDESQLPKNFRKHSIAWVIRHSFGYLLLDVEVTDLEPVEEVYKELQAKTTAKAKGAAEFQRARGERKAIEEIAAGEAQAIKLKRVEVVAPGGKLILLTNLAGEASKNIDKIVLTGGTGDVAQITTLIQALLKEDGGNGAAVGAGSQTQETAGGES